MCEYYIAHVGVNCENEEEALKGAKMFEALFGLTAKNGNSSVFAGTAVEFNKKPGRGRNGHIAIGTPDVAAAVADLEARGFTFIPESARYKPDGTLNAIYITEEICGFAVHLVGLKK